MTEEGCNLQSQYSRNARRVRIHIAPSLIENGGSLRPPFLYCTKIAPF
jgi:hypothetical protein